MSVRYIGLKSPLVDQIPGMGEVSFRALSVGDVKRLDAAKSEMPPTATTLLDSQIIRSDGLPGPMTEWTSESRTMAFKAYSRYEFAKEIDGQDEASVCHAFENAYAEWRELHKRQALETLSKIARSFEPQPPVQSALAVLQAQHRLEPLLSGLQAIQKLAEVGKPILDAVQQWENVLAPIRQLQKTLEPLEAFQKQIAAATVSNLNLPKPGAFFEYLQRLPGFSAIQKQIAESARAIEEGKETLEDADFGFALPLLDLQMIRELVVEDRKRRSLQVTNQFMATTRSPDFEDMLRRELLGSQFGKRRLKPVMQALEAHRRRHYYASVPVLTAQVEGLLTDLLGVAKVYIRHKGQWVVPDGNGPKLSRRTGKPITETLAQKVKRGKELNYKDLEFFLAYTVQTIFDAGMGRKELTDSRNDIMHGQSNNYGKPKLSTQLLITVLILAQELEASEQKIRSQQQKLQQA